jgi:hypothetical protein
MFGMMNQTNCKTWLGYRKIKYIVIYNLSFCIYYQSQQCRVACSLCVRQASLNVLKQTNKIYEKEIGLDYDLLAIITYDFNIANCE